jgi:hypothetical protein
MATAILHATSADGHEIPVIDVTHPAFIVSATDAELASLSERYVLESAQRQDAAPALLEALQRSMLGRGLMAASGTFLSGMATYLLKLGPDNLGPDANPLDRAIAASFPALTTRLRLQETARMLADGLAVTLASAAGRRLCLLNIGGGPAADSWNGLIILQAEHPELLSGRDINIAVLDVDAAGPAFGASALDALRGPDGPLRMLNVRFQHIAYKWSDADRLGHILEPLHIVDDVCAVSSEGALFEYGSDAVIVANLQQLRTATASDTIVVGSVTRDDAPTRASRASTRVSTQPRTIDAFRELAAQAGWSVECVIERPFTYNVRLRR